jgi:hypothetical protein
MADLTDLASHEGVHPHPYLHGIGLVVSSFEVRDDTCEWFFQSINTFVLFILIFDRETLFGAIEYNLDSALIKIAKRCVQGKPIAFCQSFEWSSGPHRIWILARDRTSVEGKCTIWYYLVGVEFCLVS